MMGVAQDLLNEGGAIASKLAELGFSSSMNPAYEQIAQSQFITQHWDQFSQLGIDKLQPIDYSFLGLDLGAKPSLSALGNICLLYTSKQGAHSTSPLEIIVGY